MILAIETAVKKGSIAILDNGREICSRNFNDEKIISRELLKNIDDLFNENELKKEHLTCIGVSNGPGSLTGLRVGISVALGLAASLNVGCFGVSLFDSISAERIGEPCILVIAANSYQSFWLEMDRVGFPVSSVKLINNANINELINHSVNSFIIEKNLYEFLVNEWFLDIKLIEKKNVFCPDNLAVLIGKRVSNEVRQNIARNPQPIYFQYN